ncbi:GNAT family N-acetyltransferase [Streptomyces sp. NPDC005438]|uniref:GNAT family N-acetyltransferase n=1 Tax=Streptomyces sp. NPDC005438 TaxID=3156880 RepID=UPI00339E0EBC
MPAQGHPREWPSIRPADQPGDLGWMVWAHGELYAREYGWSTRFEALVARIVADHAQCPDPGRERAWIAEVDGRRVGCVMCVAEDHGAEDSGAGDPDGVQPPAAKLRLLLVHPSARGTGLGGRLVDTCLEFARETGAARIALWTNDVLGSARRIYQARGFALVEQERHRDFGPELVGQRWERAL